MVRLLKVNSQALWSLIIAVIMLGPLFGWWHLTEQQVAGLALVYGALMMVLRQMFSLTE